MILRYCCVFEIIVYQITTAKFGYAQVLNEYQGLRHSTQTQCRDATDAAAMCARGRAMGMCTQPIVYKQCAQTCRMCPYESWSEWGPWSKCTLSCGYGSNIRTRSCPGNACEMGPSVSTKGCEVTKCRAARTSANNYLYDASNFASEERSCLEAEFKCPDSGKCIESTKKCDGVTDCSSGNDEIDCPLGLRYDGTFGIINWEQHRCMEVKSSKDNKLPVLHRRCPGPYNAQKQRYMWKWYDYRTLEHVNSRQCLSVNVTYFNGSDVPEVGLLMATCDLYDPKQHWRCSGYRIELSNPFSAVPGWNYKNIYVRINGSAEPDMANLILSHGDDDFSYFYMLGTNKRLNICAKILGSGIGTAWNWWSQCDKTCGGGTQRKKKDWATQGSLECEDCEEYDIRKCNTEPCPIECPPGFTVHVSPYNRNDKSCFKVFDEEKTFGEAQRFCQANNWTLAAIKDTHTHQLLSNLMQTVGSNHYYIGVHEKLSGHSVEAPDNSLSFLLDDQPIGSFQPWLKLESVPKTSGCIVGHGIAYNGLLNVTSTGSECYPVDGKDSFCRNSNVNMSAPWCYVEHGRELVKETCHLPNCMEFDAEDARVVNHGYNFNIRSLGGDGNQCISVLSSDKVVTASCNCNDRRQNFQWLYGVYLMNSLSGKCLATQTYPPMHGTELAAKECPAGNAPLKQGWHASEIHLAAIWDDVSGYQSSSSSWAFRAEHIHMQQKIVISDIRREHFMAWNEKLGLNTLHKLMSSSTFGSLFLLKGEACGSCIKSTDNSKRLELSSCAMGDYYQRWTRHGEFAFMNIATGLCIAAFKMRFYVLLNDCDSEDHSTHWNLNWQGENVVAIQHDRTNFYLTCGCKGYTPMCLTPDEEEAGQWEMVVNQNAPSLREQPVETSNNVGEAFMLHSALNSTKCAYPTKRADQRESPFEILMTTCDLRDTGQLWWFAKDGSWIKHRGLDLCVHGCSDDGCTVTLRECSPSKRNLQSWTVLPETDIGHNDNNSGDRICLKFNRSLCLSSQRYDDISAADYLLTLKLFNHSRHWIAEIIGGVYIPLDLINDCVPPWMPMEKYRGTTSWTTSGIKCQSWEAQWPHRHPFTQEAFPNDGLVSNYCRKPAGIPSDELEKRETDEAWCITLSPSLPWEQCSVARCMVAGVSVHSVSGLWKSTGGSEERPFICQAPAECYSQNGISFSGYYEHTGRAHCMNWREYYNGDDKWPDHARCMNWNNDTLKPWCWVARGVAQYCDVIESCPVACQDPRPMMRNMHLINVSYTSSSKYYMPGSVVVVVCKKGFQAATEHQSWTCNDKGEWTPRPHPCVKVVCPEPASYDNAVMITPKNYFYGSKVVYHCKDGSMIKPGRNVIEITCLHNGSWSQMPYECLSSCKSGWVSFNRSCFKVNFDQNHFLNYQSARQKCSEEPSGSLAVPKTKEQHDFFMELVVNSGRKDKAFWLGVRNAYDVDADVTKVFHDWIGDGANAVLPESELYLDDMKNDTFMITSFSYRSGDDVSFLDQCLFGVISTSEVLIKSCVYASEVDMQWMWTRNDHLYHMSSGLCLTEDGSRLRLGECSVEEKQQMFVCGPENGYLLRLKHQRFGYMILGQSDSADLRIGNAESREESAMWLTFPNRRYLCHWNIKPPDKIFLVHTGEFPTFDSFHVLNDDPCLFNTTGSQLASLHDLETFMDNGNLIDWCACPFVLALNRINTVANSLGDCNVRHNVGTARHRSIQNCNNLDFADSFCNLPDNPDPDFLSEKCATMHMRAPSHVEFVTRECNIPLPGYICEQPAMWACGEPPLPRNAKSAYETASADDMKFAYGSTIKITCKDGYWIESEHRYDMKLYCNEHLKWELLATYEMRDENEEKYIRDENDDPRDIYGGVGCDQIRCVQPPMVYGLEMINQTDQIYFVGDSVFFRCSLGMRLNSSKGNHKMTCTLDGTWQPWPGTNEKCIAVQCPEPPDIPHANKTYNDLVYNSTVVYKCLEGFWISKDVYAVTSNCSAMGKWIPDHVKGNVTCFPSSCENPSRSLFSSTVSGIGGLTTYFNGVAMTLKCKPGYWFDKDTHQVTFTCNKQGKWLPYHPHESKCKQIYCQPPEDVAGAIRYGSDYASGSYVRYYCSRRFWIRRQFQIYNTEWKFCLRQKNVVNSKLVYQDLAVDKSCGPAATPSYWWQWHWSYHIRHIETNLCLTATAITVLEEESVPARLEPCEKRNVMQMWTCESAKNGWALRLWSAYTGGYLIAYSARKRFWFDQSKLNYDTSVVSWNTYHYKDEDLSICIMKEGHFFEEVECNNYGLWQPNPSNIGCAVVKCGFPPKMANAHISSNHTAHLDSYAENNPHLRWLHLVEALNDFEVGNKVTFVCDTGFWVSQNLYEYHLTCLDNGVWSPDPGEVMCIPAFCPIPELRPWMKIILRKNSSTSVIPDIDSIFPERGWEEFRYPLDAAHKAKYRDLATLKCEDGYWLTRGASLGKIQTNISMSAQCYEDGRWSQTLDFEDSKCELLKCPDPGPMENAHRVIFNGAQEGSASQLFVYQSLIQYKCNPGFWISIAKRYVQIACGREAVWIPDPSDISCTPITCGDPGSISNGIKIGSNYTLTNEVVYKCNEGFRFGNVFTQRVVTCTQDGSWFPPIYSIVCDPTACGSPPTFDNSYLSAAAQRISGKYVFGDQVTIRCQDGYVFEDTVEGHFSCNKKGKWEPSSVSDILYQCKPAECEKPIFQTKYTVYERPGKYFVNDTVYYSCPTGENGLHDVDFVTCVFDAARVSRRWTVWEPDPPLLKCDGNPRCPHIDTVANSFLSVEGYMRGNVATFTCYPGYRFRDYNSSTINMFCNLYGRWRPAMFNLACVPVNCHQPMLDDMINIVTVQQVPGTFLYRDKLTLSCPTGYWVTNSKYQPRGVLSLTAECKSNGYWSAELNNLVCANVFCNSPGLLSKGEFKIRDGKDPLQYSPSTKLIATCHEGYVFSLNGESTMEFTCSNGGVWTPVDLDNNEFGCWSISCPDPGFRPYSTRYSTSFEYGRFVIYEINPGYWSPITETNRVTLMCSAGGTWVYVDSSSSRRDKRSIGASMQEILIFTPIKCSYPLSAPTNSYFQGLNRSIPTGKELTVACNSSYVLSPGVNRTTATCTLHGWIPSMDLILCAPESSVFCTIPPVSKLTVSGVSAHAGVVLTLTCEIGYALSNGEIETEIKCLENGLWEPSWELINCTEYVCADLPSVDHAVLTMAKDSGNNTAYLECVDGYSFEDDANRKTLEIVCTVGFGWHPSPLDYECIPVDCGVPSFITGGLFEYMPVIQFDCEEGNSVYIDGTPYSSVNLSCTDDGTWSAVDNPSYTDEAMVCKVTKCREIPPTVVNAQYFMHHGNHYQSTIMYHCATGYVTPNGLKVFQKICNKDGSWAPVNISPANAFCKRVSCPVIQSISGESLAEYESGGTFRQYPIKNLYGDRLRYNCSLNGQIKAIYSCNWNEQWEPYLEQPCEEFRCKTPLVIDNAIGTGDETIGSMYIYQCLSGYEFRENVSAMVFQCSKDSNDEGVWIPPFSSTMRCKLPQCPPPELPDNTDAFDRHGNRYTAEASRLNVLDMSISSYLIIKCSLGYSGDFTQIKSTCNSSRKWSPETEYIISCSPVLCDEPGWIPGAYFTNKNYGNPAGKLKYLDEVQYSCSMSYFFESERSKDISVVCMGSGLLAPDPSGLECVPASCTNEDIDNAYVIQLTGLRVGSKATYRCNEGMRFPSDYQYADFYCNMYGKWEPDMSQHVCEKVLCHPPRIERIIFEKEVVEFEEKIGVTCIAGFFLVDPSNVAVRFLTCQQGGVFSPDPWRLTCIRIQCPSLSPPANATISSSNYFGGSAVLTCSDGHLTAGNKPYTTAMCQEDGSWSRDLSQGEYACKPAACQDHPVVDNAVVKRMGKGFKTKVQINCNEGYEFNGKLRQAKNQYTASCSSDLTWETPANLSCTQIKCTSLPTLNSANLFGEEPYFGSTFTYVCNPMTWIAETVEGKLILTGRKEFRTTCGNDGQWQPPVNFHCQNLSEAKSVVQGREISSAASELSERSHKRWIEFQPELMTISDSGFSKSTVSTTLSHSIETVWDSNPLTYWISSKNYSVENAWGIDIFFGKPITVFGFMMMGFDEFRSDIASFTFVYADSKNVMTEIGPFRVYGSDGLSGNLMRDFPLKFSSVANCFVYEGLKSEMLWLHLIIHPLHEKQSVKLREIGFFASDTENAVEPSAPDERPLIFCIGILVLAAVMVPVLYFVDHKFMTVSVIYGCCGKKRACNIVQFVADSSSSIEYDLLVQLIGSNGEGPIGWVHRVKRQRTGRTRHELHIPGNVDDIGQAQKVRIMACQSGEYDLCSKHSFEGIVLKKLGVTNTEQGEFIVGSVESNLFVPNLTPVEILLQNSSGGWAKFNLKLAALLRSNLLVSVIFPPKINSLLRAERFLCLALMCVGGSAITLMLAGFFTMGSVHRLLHILSDDTLSGFFGAIVCLPLPTLLRILYIISGKVQRSLAKVSREQRIGAALITDINATMKLFLGLVEITNTSTSMTRVEPFDKFSSRLPKSVAGSFSLYRSSSCPSIRKCIQFRRDPKTSRNSFALGISPVRLSVSCHSLCRVGTGSVTGTAVSSSTDVFRHKGLWPSASVPTGGRRVVKRYYADVLHLNSTDTPPRKYLLHVFVVPVLILFIAASVAFILVHFLQEDVQLVDVTSLIMQSVMFTFLVSLNIDMLIALTLFRENI